jgi:preprotein translocase subunit YajC
MTVPHLAEDLLRLAATVIVGLVFWWLLNRSERKRETQQTSLLATA